MWLILSFSVERSFHESLNSSLIKDVEPITQWTDLPVLETSPGVPTTIVSDSIEIEDEASDILADIMAPSPSLSLIALAIKTRQRKEGPPCLEIIQLRTQDKIAVFEVCIYLCMLYSNAIISYLGFGSDVTERDSSFFASNSHESLNHQNWTFHTREPPNNFGCILTP